MEWAHLHTLKSFESCLIGVSAFVRIQFLMQFTNRGKIFFFANCGKNSIVFGIEWISKYFSLFLLLILSFASLASSRSFLDRCCGTHFHWIQFYLFDTFSVLFYFLFQFFFFRFCSFLSSCCVHIYISKSGPVRRFYFWVVHDQLSIGSIIYLQPHTQARTHAHTQRQYIWVCVQRGICMRQFCYVCLRASYLSIFHILCILKNL